MNIEYEISCVYCSKCILSAYCYTFKKMTRTDFTANMLVEDRWNDISLRKAESLKLLRQTILIDLLKLD